MAEADEFRVELQRLRLAAGFSLGELARRVNYSKGYLSKIESGKRRPSPALARLCDTVLDTDGRLAALAGVSASPHEQVEPVRPEVWVLAMAPQGGAGFHQVSRRDLLACLGPGVLNLAYGRGRAADCDHAARMMARMFDVTRRLGRSMSPAVVLPMTITLANGLDELCAHASGETRTNVVSLGARVAEFAGWMAQELGDEQAALWWTDRALTMAACGDDRDLQDYVIVRKALILMYRGQWARAADLADRVATNSRCSTRVRWLAAMRVAQGSALAGNGGRCMDALVIAHELSARAQTTDEDTLALGPNTIPDLTAIVTGGCLHDLGEPDEAVAILDAEVPRIPPSSHRSRARFGLRRVAAHIALRDLDSACDHLTGLLGDVERVDSATIRSELRDVDVLLRRWSTHPPVGRLRPIISRALAG